ncbi:flagellin lysine-N-methylase [Acidobacterium capsulatum]|uniref:flagellin lysine-N-methylase n=1 Tax=Acidobacterium capsulatum TaxID=33075 RepID=UPI001EE66D41|nr:MULTISPECIES: flagellin lysine-N-methylase [Acidobacterium]
MLPEEVRLRAVHFSQPEYARRFQCIGSSCEEDCCSGWQVTVDKPSYDRFKAIDDDELRPIFEQHLQPLTEQQKQQHPSVFAIIQMLPSGACPFLSTERLCSIQLKRGPESLCKTCATFPRMPRVIDEKHETALSLSCPEAARIVLLEEDLQISSPDSTPLLWDDQAPPAPEVRNYFWHIREFTIQLLRNRSYLLWQRLFLLGTFARRLDAIGHGQLERGFPSFLLDFENAIASGRLHASMETIPPNLPLQLDLLITMINLRLGAPLVSRRLLETIEDFGKGIGHLPGVTTAMLAARYDAAWQQYAKPFFEQHPHFLENYLINQVYRNLFPFGEELFRPGAIQEPAKHFARLAIHYSLIKGVLIGVAGCYQKNFSLEIAVKTVQSLYRNFEHHAKFLDDIQMLLAERGLDNAYGLTMLLRN